MPTKRRFDIDLNPVFVRRDRRGRRQIDDRPRLALAAELVVSGECRRGYCQGIRDAIRAKPARGERPSTTYERVRKKYAKQRDFLERQASIWCTIRPLVQEIGPGGIVSGKNMYGWPLGYVQNSLSDDLLSKRKQLQAQFRDKADKDPRFARYLERRKVRVEFASLQYLKRLWQGFFPRRRQRRIP